MARWKRTAYIAAVGMVVPKFSKAQGMADEISSLQGVLDLLYAEMMPLCSDLIGVGQGIAGFAALWYIASRVWHHIVNAEAIDFYPLFRPFAIGFAIMIFPLVLAMINGVMQPIVAATSEMVEGSDEAIAALLEAKEKAVMESDAWQMYVGDSGSGNRDKWYKYTHDNADPSGESIFESIGNDIKFSMSKASFNFRNSIKEWMSEVLGLLFEAAALCINTLRTFQLIVLAIIGPLVFGLSVFDGFQHTLTVWLARYINIFLWLPVANIFGAILGKIQVKMLALDISQVEGYGDTFFSPTDMGYLVFMIIGIIGYFTVPSVANYIVHAAGGNALGQKVTSMFSSASGSVVTTAAAGAGMAADAGGRIAGRLAQGIAKNNVGGHNFMGNPKESKGYMGDKLKGIS